MIRIPGGEGYFGAQKYAQRREKYNEFIQTYKKPMKKQRIKE